MTREGERRRDGYPAMTVTPYLTIKGADRAIAFYREVFGAEEEMREMADDGERLLHATLRLRGGYLMLSDDFPDLDGALPPDPNRASPVAISLAHERAEQVDEIHAKALFEGAREIVAPMNAHWGARFAMFTDPFGHRWLLTAPAGA